MPEAPDHLIHPLFLDNWVFPSFHDYFLIIIINVMLHITV